MGRYRSWHIALKLSNCRLVLPRDVLTTRRREIEMEGFEGTWRDTKPNIPDMQRRQSGADDWYLYDKFGSLLLWLTGGGNNFQEQISIDGVEEFDEIRQEPNRRFGISCCFIDIDTSIGRWHIEGSKIRSAIVSHRIVIGTFDISSGHKHVTSILSPDA